jgi:hemoglobin
MMPSPRLRVTCSPACRPTRSSLVSGTIGARTAWRARSKLLIDFLCSSAGSPLYYTGRDMKTTHRNMGISAGDWSAFLTHLDATLTAFKVPQAERDAVVAFVNNTKAEIVEA